jgi:hypothetical protein
MHCWNFLSTVQENCWIVFVFGEAFNFFSDPEFLCKSMKEYSTHDTPDLMSSYNYFWEEGIYELVYDTAQMDLAPHKLLTGHDDTHLADAHANFWACWMLPNANEPIRHNDVAIILLVVSKTFMTCIKLSGSKLSNLDDDSIRIKVLDHLICVDKK